MDQQIQKQIASLPAAEQLEIAEFIYQSLAFNGRLLTEEQIEETRRRSSQVDENPSSLMTRDEMWAEVDRLRHERKN